MFVNFNRLLPCILILSIFPLDSVYGASRNLAAEIENIDVELENLSTEGQKYEAGIIKSLIEAREHILKLSKEAMQLLLLAEEASVKKNISYDFTEPDPMRAAEILKEISRQIEIVANAEAEAKETGGLIQALAISRVETEKLTLAQLKLGYFQALYGLPIQILTQTADVNQDEIDQAEISNVETEDSLDLLEPLPWADERYPEINYDTPAFSYYQNSYYFQGYWAIRESKSEIDDSLQIMALNRGDWERRPSYDNNQLINIRCVENKTSFVYYVDTYLMNTDYNSSKLRVTYRIDDDRAVKTRWYETTSNKAVGLFDKEAEKFLSTLYNAKKLFLRVAESDGSTHDTSFNLTGISETLEKVGKVCGFSAIELKKSDYKAIQSLLNANGFDAGAPDGVWGRGSKKALTEFQLENGLEPTGLINALTLEKLGLK